MIILYSVCLSLALGIQHILHMRLIAICGLLYSTIYFSINSQTVWSCKKKLSLNVRFDFL